MPYLVPGVIMFAIVLVADIILILWKLESTQPRFSTSGYQVTAGVIETLSRQIKASSINGVDEEVIAINQPKKENVWLHVRSTFKHFPKLSLHCIVVVFIGLITA